MLQEPLFLEIAIAKYADGSISSPAIVTGIILYLLSRYVIVNDALRFLE